MLVSKDSIVSSTEIAKNFGKYGKKVKENSLLFVLKHNNPDLVVMDFDKFELLVDCINKLEDDVIYTQLENRSFSDECVLYSLDEAKEIIHKIKKLRG